MLSSHAPQDWLVWGTVLAFCLCSGLTGSCALLLPAGSWRPWCWLVLLLAWTAFCLDSLSLLHGIQGPARIACQFMLLLSGFVAFPMLANLEMKRLVHVTLGTSLILACWTYGRAACFIAEESHSGVPSPRCSGLLEPASHTLSTDGSTPVQIYAWSAPNDDRPVALSPQVLQTAPPSATCNCHGWVFTGGLYHIDCSDVDTILRDNGYRIVTQPIVGDLIVYRDTCGSVCHSGIVRATGSDDLVLIESKWGIGARFLHPPHQSKYPNHFTYHRSPRSGHLLRELGGNSEISLLPPTR